MAGGGRSAGKQGVSIGVLVGLLPFVEDAHARLLEPRTDNMNRSTDESRTPTIAVLCSEVRRTRE